jgi:multidrug efflux pump subunit AcrA (membrane-fusion protein)
VGDQCWSGFPLIQLPDLSILRANVKINEIDIAKISKGVKVEIKPDAFTDSVFHGEVSSVANLAVNKDNKSKVKVFPVEISINGTDEKLLPGLTVSCRIILGKLENVLSVPIESINTEGDNKYVYKKISGGYDKIKVTTGESNKNYVIINEGLTEDDVIALMDPFHNKKDDESNKQKEE